MTRNICMNRPQDPARRRLNELRSEVVLRVLVTPIAFALALGGSVLGAAPAAAQDQAASARSGTSPGVPAVNLSVPDRQVWLGTVRLPAPVLADGQALAAGTYRVRLTGEHASTDVVGQSEQLERWVEFVKGKEVKAKVLAPVVPSADARDVVRGPVPRLGAVRVQRLKGDDYYRVWFNYKGDQVMIYLPTRS
jgi:hypothetical protein